MLVNPLKPAEGGITAPDGPGFGMEIKEEVWHHPAAVVEVAQVS